MWHKCVTSYSQGSRSGCGTSASHPTYKDHAPGVAQVRHILLTRITLRVWHKRVTSYLQGSRSGCGTSASHPTHKDHAPGVAQVRHILLTRITLRVWHKRVTSYSQGSRPGCGTSASPLHLPMLFLLALGVHKNPPLKIMPRYRGNHPSLPTA
jgi:hypothetical protein